MTTMESANGGVPQWTVGDRLRKARDWRDISIEDMAEEIGRTERTIRNYENDVTTPSLAVIKQYALRTGVPLDWIRYGIENSPPSTPTGLPTGRRAAKVTSLVTKIARDRNLLAA